MGYGQCVILTYVIVSNHHHEWLLSYVSLRDNLMFDTCNLQTQIICPLLFIFHLEQLRTQIILMCTYNVSHDKQKK